MASLEGIGPNVQRLICERASAIIIEGNNAGDKNFEYVLTRLINGELGSTLQEATKWTRLAVRFVQEAPDTEWHTDEAAAGEVLRRLEIKRKREMNA